MNSIIISVKSKKVPEQKVYEKYRNQFLAKCIYNVMAFVYYVLASMAIVTLCVIGTHTLLPNINFYTFLALIMVEMIPGLGIIAIGAYASKVGIYKLLCMLTRK